MDRKRTLQNTAKIMAPVILGLLLGSCSKNNIYIYGDEDTPSPDNPSGTKALVTFHASIEDRNLLTRAMAPMEKGIQNRLYAFNTTNGNPSQASPAAEGLYITSSPGILIGTDGYKMYLDNGVYDFYAVSDNFSTYPPEFTAGKSEPLFNGIDYLWWHSPQHDVNSSQINIPIIYLHTCTQIVIQIAAGDSIELKQLISALITPSEPGSSMDLATGTIPPSTTYGKADKMGINGFTAQYIMLPLRTTVPLSLTLDIEMKGESNYRTYSVEIPVPDGELKAGNSYLFEAVIEENSVTFSNVYVKKWTEVDEEGNPLYPVQKN